MHVIQYNNLRARFNSAHRHSRNSLEYRASKDMGVYSILFDLKTHNGRLTHSTIMTPSIFTQYHRVPGYLMYIVVTVHRQDSMRLACANAVLAVYCNYFAIKRHV